MTLPGVEGYEHDEFMGVSARRDQRTNNTLPLLKKLGCTSAYHADLSMSSEELRQPRATPAGGWNLQVQLGWALAGS